MEKEIPPKTRKSFEIQEHQHNSPKNHTVRRVYHQAAGGYLLTRDEIQPAELMIYATLRTSMIYQAKGLSPAAWMTKKTSFEVFFVCER